MLWIPILGKQHEKTSAVKVVASVSSRLLFGKQFSTSSWEKNATYIDYIKRLQEVVDKTDALKGDKESLEVAEAEPTVAGATTPTVLGSSRQF